MGSDAELSGVVRAVCVDGEHRFSKVPVDQITVLAGIGVEGDAHSGPTVKHRSRVRPDGPPNLRQVHLMHAELFDEVAAEGFTVNPGELGENVTTHGIDLLGLPTGTVLRLGDDVLLAITGMRNPCVQIDRFQPGLRALLQPEGPDGGVVRKAGIMSVVVQGGTVRPGDPIGVALPPHPHTPLQLV